MMQIYSTFDHSVNLELAISALEMNGIAKEAIFAVPLSKRKLERKLFDTMHQADGVTLISTGAVLGTAFAVIGASIGFRLEWGPIYWGLIGTSAGFILGLLIDLFYYKVLKKLDHPVRGNAADVVLIVECEEPLGDKVEHILWHHFAHGVARVR